MCPFKFVAILPQLLRFPTEGFHILLGVPTLFFEDQESHPSRWHKFCFSVFLIQPNSVVTTQALFRWFICLLPSELSPLYCLLQWGYSRETPLHSTSLRVTMLPTQGSGLLSTAHICIASIHKAKHRWLEK